MRNNEYGILKWFAEFEQVSGAPGLDLPALETAEIARGYGVDVARVRSRDELREALTNGFATDGPSLVEVDVAPGMSLF
jgi:benzoylformate decarboxylase